MQSYLIVQTPQLRYTQGRKNCCNLSCFKFLLDIASVSVAKILADQSTDGYMPKVYILAEHYHIKVDPAIFL